MLALSRRLNETIHIGNNIVITVTRLRGSQVTILVDAPRDIPVFRGEIYDATRHTQENEGEN